MSTKLQVRQAAYERALAAEPTLADIERTVDALCSLVRPDDTMCVGCVWETIVKPLTTPWVGYGRGYAPHSVGDGPFDRARRIQAAQEGRPIEDIICITLSNLPVEAPLPATTADEEWMRTSEAWDAVTDTWLAKLDKADPGNGHGLHGKLSPKRRRRTGRPA